MEEEEYKVMYEAEEGDWWYVGMREITFSLLDRYCEHGDLHILDAGCGTGIMLAHLRRYGITFGVDLAEEAVKYCWQRGEQNVSRASVNMLPFADEHFDLVTSFDVIYTLETNTRLAIREFRRVLKKNGLLMIRVPAYDWLRGQHDLAVHTRHRFTTQELRRELVAGGFLLEKVTYCNTWLFPLALVKRLVLERLGIGTERSDVKPLAGPLNTALASVLAGEAKSLRWVDLPFGLSVVAIARPR